MYCAKCGSELKNNEAFCSNCGTKSGTSGKAINFNISASDIKNKAVNIRSNFKAGLVDLGKYKWIVFANIALLLLSMFFSTMSIFKLDAVLEYSRSISLYESEDGVKNVFIIVYLISAIITLLPLLLNKVWKGIYFLPEKITTIITMYMFFSIWNFYVEKIDEQRYGGLANFEVSIVGWLFAITTVGAIILSFKIPMDLKNKYLKKSDVQEECEISDTNDNV